MKTRLDQAVVARGLVATRSQAESWIKLGKVTVDGKVQAKPGFLVGGEAAIKLTASEQYVSRAALKLASVAKTLKLSFKGKIVLDVGSSTGGFTDYALQHGARKVIAVEAGKDQLHPTLRGDDRIELYEQTDIRDLVFEGQQAAGPGGPSFPQRARSAARAGGPPRAATRFPASISEIPDMVVIDVSFISLREILPHVATLCGPRTQIVAMAKPQFEAAASNLKHKGVIKNDRMRREILKDFEAWVRQQFVIADKADSAVAGAKGNLERFYLLAKNAR